jgi:hypothetical protein
VAAQLAPVCACPTGYVSPIADRISAVIGATNRAADLDLAFLRPGPFDRTIGFDPPKTPGEGEEHHGSSPD